MAGEPKVVITDYDYGDVDLERNILEAAGARVVALQAKSEEELFAEARDCDALMNQYARVGAATIARMEHCRVIARYGVGVDIVDVDAATRKGILVTNVRDYCTDEVADHAIALWLALVRKLFVYNQATHEGVWHWKSGEPVYRIGGRTMGIVSFGKIGRAIAARAKSFGVELLVHDPYVADEVAEAHGARRVGKTEILERSDYMMMQVPMTDETRHFLGDAELRAIKPGVIIVNTGRGPTIDNRALYRALTEGRVTGAGLDDPEEEPAKRKHWSPSDNPLFSLPNVIVTPHVAYYSQESIRFARQTAASEVARVLRGEKPLNLVNDPGLLGRPMAQGITRC
jgi:D-3-phosphoglycerate dehydrogenase